MMYFKGARIPTQTAERCAELLPKYFPDAVDKIPPKDLTAFVLCALESWRDMKASWTTAANPSQLDEDDEANFIATRSEQIARTHQFLTQRGVEAAVELATAFVRAWQPSARCPELDVENYFAAQKDGGTRRERECMFLMGLRDKTSTLPTEPEVRLIVENVHWAAPAWSEIIRMKAGEFALHVIARLKGHEQAEIGFRILRAVSLFDPFAKARLARLLTVGWNRKNRQQAWDLVIQVSEESFDENPLADLIYHELADAAAALATSDASPKQVSKVIRILEGVADRGYWKAALYLYHYYSVPSEACDDDPDKVYSNKVAPDKEKAQRYRAIVSRYPNAEYELSMAMKEARGANDNAGAEPVGERGDDKEGA
ncbi:hypothetical protein P0D73_15820 [Paraburkholderia sp. RL18-101-BIB-B]|uniref:hypothetical protein n=1 Tax=Paraburkholderia sp. RL18-101-BIB-B TaxID=3031634 RepID=UPI0038BCA209